MSKSSTPAWRPFLLLTLALLSLLGAGALHARHSFLTRGIPQDLPEPVSHGGAKIGLNVYLQDLRAAELDNTLQRIEAAGVRFVKQPFHYDTDGAFLWNRSDAIVEAIHRNNLQLAALLDGDPTDQFAPPADLADFAAWAAEFARRYGEHVRYYFIWDEPNLSSHWGLQPANPADYAALLAVTAEAIRAADGDAVIVAAPLAPTVETGPENLSDILYLEELYGAGAQDSFDVVSGKPYGFSLSPYDRTVDPEVLNFSRAILLREVMEKHGDGGKALFAGNWGWNALPETWEGSPSIWGQADPTTRVAYMDEALQRAQREWPWMGLMFLEAWHAPGASDDPRHGFDVVDTPLENSLPELAVTPESAFPGFYLASEEGQGQTYGGNWRFSPDYGADISESGDSVLLEFWGTHVGLRVRRADYRARLYVTVDGKPASELPNDGDGTALVLTSPHPQEDYLEIVTVASGLDAGPHLLEVEAYRGWEQWALNGFSVGYEPDPTPSRIATIALLFTGAILAIAAMWDFRSVPLPTVSQRLHHATRGLSARTHLLLTLLVALLVTLTGWLTWGEQAAGVYRRLGDSTQLLLTASAAVIFYIAPTFLVFVPALLILVFLVYARPAWGLALVALFFPFYVLPKPMAGYRFSPVEIFVFVTALAIALRATGQARRALKHAHDEEISVSNMLFARWRRLKEGLQPADFAAAFFLLVSTLSLIFTQRLDVAQNEWRVVIFEPVLFYAMVRWVRPTSREMWIIIDAFVLGAVVVALYGLLQYAIGQNVITVAGGLGRLRSVYGSPNNVALYLGRVVPFLFAVALMGGTSSRRRQSYALGLLPIGIALILTFSKGGLFLGIPAGVGVVFLLWLHQQQRAVWPWIAAGAMAALVLVLVVANVPGLAERLDLIGTTSFLRLSLWQASVNMFADHLLFGVGLDNFLYAYRGRYILESAWEEPNLNHPHNIFLDFGTRLGIAGLFAGLWLFTALLRNLWRLPGRVAEEWRPVAIASAGTIAQTLAHGMVDHSFFLVDLSFTFFLLLSLSVWLRETTFVTTEWPTG